MNTGIISHIGPNARGGSQEPPFSGDPGIVFLTVLPKNLCWKTMQNRILLLIL